MTFLSYACPFMFFSSVATLALKNDAADNIIRRRGKTITNDNRSLSERFLSLLSDYTYLFIPFYNLYKTIKLIKTKTTEYAYDREVLLNQRERIVDKPVKKEVVKEPTKKEVKKEIEPEVKKQKVEVKPEKQMQKEPEIKRLEVPSPIDSSLSLEELNDLKNYYYELDSKYREEYKRLVDNNASAQEKNALIDKIIAVDDKFKKVVRDIKVIESQNKENTHAIARVLK